jgi:hypothetical protein
MATVRRHDLTGHRAWMMRAYAIRAGAGTQVFTEGVSETVFGINELSSGLALGAGRVINLTVAEILIARSNRGRRWPTTSRNGA